MTTGSAKQTNKYNTTETALHFCIKCCKILKNRKNDFVKCRIKSLHCCCNVVKYIKMLS